MSSNLEEIKLPLILVNFKTYSEATGIKGLELARKAQEISLDTEVSIAVAPQYTDIKTIADEVEIPVFSQHIDPVAQGAYTGHITAEAVKDAGAVGTLLNHSERRLKLSEIDEALRKAKSVGLTTVVCANTPSVSAATAALNPEMVAIEPPELIGTGVAVSKAKPEVIKQTVSQVMGVNSKIAILCGAGITSGEDVSAALKLGMQGVLVASGVVKAKNQKVALLDLANPIREAAK